MYIYPHFHTPTSLQDWTAVTASSSQNYQLKVTVTWVHTTTAESTSIPADPPTTPYLPSDFLYPLYVPTSSAARTGPLAVAVCACVSVAMAILML